jgi:hypothetical protein
MEVSEPNEDQRVVKTWPLAQRTTTSPPTAERPLLLPTTTFSSTTTAITTNAGTSGRWLADARTTDEANGCDRDMTVPSQAGRSPTTGARTDQAGVEADAAMTVSPAAFIQTFWSRPGPTPTNTIGTPMKSSMKAR